jgi:hypothetical protein
LRMVAMALGVKILPGLIVPVAVALSFLSRVIVLGERR